MDYRTSHMEGIGLMSKASTAPGPRADYRKPSLRRRASLAQVTALNEPSPMPPSIKAISGLLLRDSA